MSWSFSGSGLPGDVAVNLAVYGNSLTGDAKAEFDAAGPSIRALLLQNHGPTVHVELNAYGSSSKDSVTGVESERTCGVNLHTFHKLEATKT